MFYLSCAFCSSFSWVSLIRPQLLSPLYIMMYEVHFLPGWCLGVFLKKIKKISNCKNKTDRKNVHTVHITDKNNTIRTQKVPY